MQLLSSLSHQEGIEGTTAILRRERIVQPDGTVVDVPVISGNAWRGQLRDATMRAMLRALGDPPLSLPAFHLLFSGGSLTATGPYVDIGFARELREAIPAIGVFGGAVGNQILRGKLKVGKLYPICRETAHLLSQASIPAEFGIPSIWELIQEEEYTRADDEKREDLRQLIDPMARAVLEAEAGVKRAKKAAGDEELAPKHSQQMRYGVETLAAGSYLACEIVLEDASELEFAALVDGLAEWARDPHLGGKRATGHGLVRTHFAEWFSAQPAVSGDAVALAGDVGYAAHLSAQRAAILDLLGRLR